MLFTSVFPEERICRQTTAFHFLQTVNTAAWLLKRKELISWGAAQFLFPEGNEDLLDYCADYGKEGLRVLVLAHSSQVNKENELPEGLKPVAIFTITDIIRENAPETLEFLKVRALI